MNERRETATCKRLQATGDDRRDTRHMCKQRVDETLTKVCLKRKVHKTFSPYVVQTYCTQQWNTSALKN